MKCHVASSLFVAVLPLLILSAWAGPTSAETFPFGSNANPGINLQPTYSKTVGDFTLDLAAGPEGALLRETSTPGGLGVASVLLVDPDDPPVDPGGFTSFDVLQAAYDGVSEFVQFSFDKPGVLTGIDFDGVKDEWIEFFTLETTGVRINFFDSRANIATPGAVDDALSDGAIEGDVIYMLEDDTYDDQVIDLAIPFAANQVFQVTYDYLGDVYGQGAGDGSILQGITVRGVPEPATSLLAASAGLLLAWARRRNRYSAVAKRNSRVEPSCRIGRFAAP